MTDYCDNIVVIEAPEANLAALLAAFEGPSNFWWPCELMGIQSQRSAHEQLELENVRVEAEAAYAAAGRPAFIPVTIEDIAWWRNDPTLADHPSVKQVVLSLPKLRPWSKREDYETYSADEDVIGWNRRTIGCKWVPSVEGQEWETPDHAASLGRRILRVRFDTAWQPPIDVLDAFSEALATAGASALWLFHTYSDGEFGGSWFEDGELMPLDAGSMPMEEDPDDNDNILIAFATLFDQLEGQGVDRVMAECLYDR